MFFIIWNLDFKQEFWILNSFSRKNDIFWGNKLFIFRKKLMKIIFFIINFVSKEKI